MEIGRAAEILGQNLWAKATFKQDGHTAIQGRTNRLEQLKKKTLSMFWIRIPIFVIKFENPICKATSPGRDVTL